MHFRYITTIGKLYTFFAGVLGGSAYDGEVRSENRLIDIYHGQVGNATQKRITEVFSQTTSTTRILFSTVGFGMRVDIKDVDRIVHWGVSQSIMFYWQEVGRAGRDGRKSQAILYVTAKSLVEKKTAPEVREMVAAVKQGMCVRKAILGHFAGGEDRSDEKQASGCNNCRCCSVCCHKCSCR